MKKYLIFDLDGTLVQSGNQIDRIIFNYIQENLDPELLEHAAYLVKNNQWMSLFQLIEILLECDKQTAQFHGNRIYKEINKVSQQINFFEWVPEKITELSKKYTLFLSTWNTDKFAKKVLKQWGIYDCFEKIMGSTLVKKSPDHIKHFMNHIDDKEFIDKSVFIGDGQIDEAISKFFWMDFVHISPFKENKFHIKNVNQIDDILNYFF